MQSAASHPFCGRGAFGGEAFDGCVDVIPNVSHALVGREVTSLEGYALLYYPRTFTIALRMRAGEAAWQGA